MRGDLHLHSAYSDGSATVIELIQQAVSKGPTHIAITDHDRVPRCGDIPPVTALKVMPGIEISAYDFQKQRKAHILGYAMRDTRSVTASAVRCWNAGRLIACARSHFWQSMVFVSVLRIL